MSSLISVTPSEYTPAANLVLIYTDDSKFYSKDHSGTSTEIAASVLKVLGIAAAELPALAFEEDVTAAVSKSVASVDGVSIAIGAKASSAYAKTLADRKVDKKVFLAEKQATADALAALDTAKVDKVTNKSLVSDSEISKLAAYPEYSEVQSAISSAISQVFRYKGIKTYVADLPASTDDPAPAVGDVWFVTKNNSTDDETIDAEFAWNGTKWEQLGTSGYMKSYVDAELAKKKNIDAIVYVDEGTALAPQAVDLSVDKHYIVSTECTLTLPDAPADGTVIRITTVVGGADRQVVLASGSSDTILGSVNPCAIGIDGDGIAIDVENYTFLYVEADTNWIVL